MQKVEITICIAYFGLTTMINTDDAHLQQRVILHINPSVPTSASYRARIRADGVARGKSLVQRSALGASRGVEGGTALW